LEFSASQGGWFLCEVFLNDKEEFDGGR